MRANIGGESNAAGELSATGVESNADLSAAAELSSIVGDLHLIEQVSEDTIRLAVVSQSEVDQIKVEIESASHQRDNLIQDLDKRLRDVEAKRATRQMTETDLKNATETFEGLQSHIGEVEIQRDSVIEQMKQKDAEIARLRSNIETIMSSKAQIESDTRKNDKEVLEVRNQLKALNTKYQQSIGLVSRKTSELEQQQFREMKALERMAELQKKLSEYSEAEAANTSVIGLMKTTIESLETEKANISESLRDSTETLNRVRKELTVSQTELQSRRSVLDQETVQFQRLEKRMLSTHESETAELRATINRQAESAKQKEMLVEEIGRQMAERELAIGDLKRHLEELSADTVERTSAVIAEKAAIGAALEKIASENAMLVMDKQSAERAIETTNAERAKLEAQLADTRARLEAERLLAGSKMSLLGEEVRRAENRLGTAQALVDTNNRTMAALEATMATQTKELQRNRQELRDTQAATAELTKNRAALAERVNTLQEDQKRQQSVIRTTQAEVVAALDQVRSLEKEISKRDLTIETLRTERESLLGQVRTRDGELTELNEQVTRLRISDAANLKQITLFEEELRRKATEISSAKVKIETIQRLLEEKNAAFVGQQETIGDLVRSLETTNRTLEEKEKQLTCSRDGIIAQMQQMTSIVGRHREVLERIQGLTRVETELKQELKQELGTRLNGFLSQIESVRQSMCDKLQSTYDDEKLRLVHAFEGKMGLIQQRLNEIDLLEQDIQTRRSKFTYIDKFLEERQQIIKEQSEFINTQQAMLTSKRDQAREVNAVLDEYSRLLENRTTFRSMLVDLRKRNDEHLVVSRELHSTNQEFEKLKTRVSASNPTTLADRVDATERTVGFVLALVGGQVVLNVLRWMLF